MSCPPPDPPPVVIDNGSWTLKAGFAGDKKPRFQIPSTSIIQDGNVTQWDKATELWRETFEKLSVSPDNQPVLLTEPTLTSKSDREKITQVMFENLNAKALYLADPSILSLYATGRFNGVILQVGYGVTQVVSSSEGNPIRSASLRNNFAGQKLDEFMGKLLEDQDIKGMGIDSIRDIKENHSYIALDHATEEQNWESVKKKYKLPDGQEVWIGKPRFTCPEALFQPNLAGQSSPGIHSLLNDGISKAVADSKLEASALYGSIIVTGGSTLFPGMIERLKKEMQSLAPSGTSIDITAADALNSSFIGGSILTCLPNMNPLWVTKEMYLESGAAIVHEKCV